MAKQLFKDISVGKGGAVWAIGKADSRIYRLIGDAGYIGFMPDPVGRGESIAAVDWGSAFTVNKKGEIWELTGGEMYLDGKWQKMETVSGQNDAKLIAYHNTVWYIQADNQIIQPSSNVGASFWQPAANGRGVSVAPLGVHHALCVNDAGEIWSFDRNSWTKMSGYQGQDNAKMIAAGSNDDGSSIFYYVSKDGVLYQYLYGNWQLDNHEGAEQLPEIATVSVGGENLIWCLTTAGEPYRLLNGKWEKFVEQRREEIQWQYTVKAGDQLNKIVMAQFGLRDAKAITERVNLIVAQNGIENRNQIQVGQVLRLEIHRTVPA